MPTNSLFLRAARLWNDLPPYPASSPDLASFSQCGLINIYIHVYSKSNSLRKLACSNILKILPPKNGNFQIKTSDIFNISAQNIDCGYSLELPRRGGSNEYPQSMILSRNKKINVYPCKPQFYYIKVGFKGGQNYIGMFSWCWAQ